MTRPHHTPPRLDGTERLPLSGLAALGAAGFVTIMTEALPAGILPAMSAGLGVSEAAAGQTVTIYAVGSVLAAVPLTAATMGWPRRRLLLLAVAGFAVANTITAVSDDYVLTMLSRLLAGVVAGLLWALLAGYARRMVEPRQRGTAMAIVMAGTPVALSIGVPAGTFVSGLIGWRLTFGSMTLLALLLIGWVLASVPEFAGDGRGARVPVRRTLLIPGMAAVLFVTLAFVLAHNILYTYIAPYLERAGLGDRVDVVLLVFGVASLLSIWLTGALIDRHLRLLMIAGCGLFALASLTLGVFIEVSWLVIAAVGIWGLSFGGAATLLQTASAETAGGAGDVAQSLVVTCWNLGIAGGAVAGGLLLAGVGAGALPWAAFGLVVAALVVTISAGRAGFVGRAVTAGTAPRAASR